MDKFIKLRQYDDDRELYIDPNLIESIVQTGKFYHDKLNNKIYCVVVNMVSGKIFSVSQTVDEIIKIIEERYKFE